MRRLTIVSLIIALLGAGGGAMSAAAARVVSLRFYDRHGTPLTPSRVREVMTNHGAGWANDALVDPTTLQDLGAQPLHVWRGNLAFDLPSRPVALAINWPTTRGYSLVILDDGGAGFSSATSVNFTFQAALDAKRRLDAMLAVRPSYVRSSAFIAAYDAASSYLQSAGASTNESYRGRDGQLALDRLEVANDLLLFEYGPADAHSRLGISTPWIGTTLDTTAHYRTNLDLARATTEPFGWVRVVFDFHAPPSAYAGMVNDAMSHSLHILGEPIDSYDARRYTLAQYLARLRTYVKAFPHIDAWEVGNEANGSWLGAGMARKVSAAASYVRAHTTASVELTLYWQLGTDAPRWSTFNWVRANLPASTRRNLDVVLLSTYVEDAPLGLAFDQVMRTLHAEFPGQRLGLGELDYWASDTSRAWWAVDRGDPTGTARRAVASFYYAASLGYAYAVGGCFWWYFAEEGPADPGLRSAIREVVDRTA